MGPRMRLRLGRFKLEIAVSKRSPDQVAMADFSLGRGLDEIAVFGFMVALLVLGFLSALLGAVSAGGTSRFWESFLGGVALLAMMTIPIWFVQRWQAMARPVFSPQGVRAFGRARIALLVLWIYVLAVAGVGLVINFQTNASFEATLAVGMLIAYIAGWGVLLLLTFRKSAARAGRPARRWLSVRSR